MYSEKGNNGKGTLCVLMRQLVGEGRYASIPLKDFGKDFMLEPLIRATSVIVDENDVGTYIDKAANLKAVITGDTIQVNRKFKQPIFFKFKGFMVQCLNEMPRVKDKSDSFYRRQLFIPFTKCFTGAERKYIKDDYLKRKEVVEYVMYKVLNINYYEFDVPEACKNALEEYKEFNDPVRQFMSEIITGIYQRCSESAERLSRLGLS
jgi:putative DNA primase/helicase